MDNHAKMCSWTDERANMRRRVHEGIDEWTNMHFSRIDEAIKHAIIQARSNVRIQHEANPTTIKDSAHFAMWRWSCDTPWGHPSPISTAAQHAHQQQHKCTFTIMSSHVMTHLSHITSVDHTVVNQCNVTWNSKRPTCHMKSHVKLKSQISQIVMR